VSGGWGVWKFSPELRGALEKLGFWVADAKDYAEWTGCIVRVEQRGEDDVRMIVVMSNEAKFVFRLKPQHFINKAEG